MAAQATPFSLWNDLTAIRDNYAATEFIKYLVQTIGYYASSATRNTQTSYRLVTRCRDICNEINRLIKSVETSQDSWADFETYTVLIDPLEEQLLKIANDIEFLDETVERRAINDLFASVNSWKAKREALRNCLEKLYPNSDSTLLKTLPAPNNWQDDLNSARKHDDLALLRGTCDDMTTHPLCNEARLRPYILKVTTQFTRIRSGLKAAAAIDDAVVVLSVRCAIVMQGVMVLSMSNDPAVRQPIRTRTLWIKAELVLNLLSEHINSGSPGKLKKIQDDWADFEKWLTETAGISIPKSYQDLMPYAAKIRRAYYSQGLALISGCRTMAAHFESNKSTDSLKPLEEALNATTDALKDAMVAMPLLNSEYKPNSPEHSKAVASLNSANEKIIAYFSECSMDVEKTKHTNVMKAAAALDNDRMRDLKDKLTGEKWKDRNRNPMAPTDDISITVRRSQARPQENAAHSVVTTYKVPKTTPLNAILWKECIGVTTGLRPSRFHKKENGSTSDWPGFKPLQLNMQLKDLGTTEVFLVIDDEKI